MTMAPTSAPTSGRVSSRDIRDRRAYRSSAAGAGGGAGRVSRVVMGGLLPGSGLGELADDGDVGLVHQVWTGQGRLATAEDVAVGLVQPDGVDGAVPLKEGLLVDGPLQRAGLDLRRDLRVEVEGGDLRLAAGVLHRLDGAQRERGTERDHHVDALVLLELGTDGRLHRRLVPAVDVDLVVLAAEALLDAVAAGLELHLALFLHDAEHVLGAVLRG